MSGSSSEIRELQRKVLMYEKALGAVADGFLIVGRDGRVLEINQAYCDFFGVDREETLGKDIFSVIPNTRMMEIMERGITEVDALHKFIDGQSPTGERTVAVSRMPVIDGDETIASVAIVKFSRYTITLAESLRKAEDEAAYYRKQLRRHGFNSFAFADLPSASTSYKKAKRMAHRFADSDFPILLLGETGVGKEVFAHAIHQASDRKNGPFVCVNCASIPSELLESELFGYIDGAFTGSRKGGKRGKFELANGGTLLLDEIGDMPAFMQGKLLRVLQSQEVEKLGSEKNTQVDIRILAATNRDLLKQVEAGSFRADLYYRLNVLPIQIPPLRERIEDIHGLSNHFLEDLNEKYGRNIVLAPETLLILMRYHWPGNVRELRNVLDRGFMMVDEGYEILPEHLPSSVRHKSTLVGGCDASNDVATEVVPEDALVVASSSHEWARAAIPEAARHAGQEALSGMGNGAGSDTISVAKTRMEREVIMNCLQRFNGNFTKAAKTLGIHRTTLYTKVSSLGIQVERFRKER